MNKKKEKLNILVIGSDGQVGYELVKVLQHLGEVYSINRHRLDVTNTKEVYKLCNDIRPNIIINAVAYTNVDGAEENKEVAMAVNGYFCDVIGKVAKKHQALLVHYSTDYVFNGEKDEGYSESDCTDPLNYYGVTKEYGENAIIASGCEYIIIRTSWVYSIRRSNFLLTMAKIIHQNPVVSVVSDQYGIPTWANTIAFATASMLAKHRSIHDKCEKIYHMTCNGKASWYDFAKLIESEIDGSASKVHAITSDQYPAKAKRPKNTVLKVSKLEEDYDFLMPNWRDPVVFCCKELKASFYE